MKDRQIAYPRFINPGGIVVTTGVGRSEGNVRDPCVANEAVGEGLPSCGLLPGTAKPAHLVLRVTRVITVM